MPVALVTGASRGIGKAIAVHLGRAGFDVAITACTLSEGEQREHSSTVRQSDLTPLPGSLTTTAGLIEAAGVRCLTVPADLTDRGAVMAAADEVISTLGPVDVLVNNGRYVGPGHMDHFVDTPLELLDLHLEANVMAPLALVTRVLPGMLDRGSGTIVNITSSAAYEDPPAPAGDGGWGLGYAISKGALHRIAGILALELGDRGIHAYNLQPGFIANRANRPGHGPIQLRRVHGCSSRRRRGRRRLAGHRSRRSRAERTDHRGTGSLPTTRSPPGLAGTHVTRGRADVKLAPPRETRRTRQAPGERA